jgi:class 3 adenylate cyclase/predicted ATPase
VKRSLLAQYAKRFAENDIDVTVLPDLTEQDLRELGVSLGHRRHLLSLFAQLREPSQVTRWSPEESPAVVRRPAQDAAERRQVTIVFSDLVGSTALSATLDPEDLREILADYRKCATEVMQRFGGFVAQYLGDGVLVYFGYPEAHEDDAERAVRAGLELVSAVAALTTHVTLQSRVGIATGLVVVGDILGAGEAGERGIVGETPNLAARVQGVAGPQMVAIADSTRRLVGELFELEDLGAKDLKGLAAPVRVWTALRPSAMVSRFEALRGGGGATLIGREEEYELLSRSWAMARSGAGQVVLLSGEGGIGKSRLTAELLARLATEPHGRLRYFCSPQHTHSALYPIIGQLERAAGLTQTDSPAIKLDKLDAALARTSTPPEAAALLAEMLSLPKDVRHPVLSLTPLQRRQRTFDALTANVEALARLRPLLIIFEDAHWADPTTLEALSRLIDRIPQLPVLAIVTFRPEFEPPWTGWPRVTPLHLKRLTEHDIEAVIDSVAGDRPLSEDMRRDIIERTDGVPLFVEEMTKAVLEAESDGAARRTVATAQPRNVPVPASLHAMLMARLGRLGAAKEVAQAGAAIGREFSQALLALVAQQPEAQLTRALDRLVSAGLLLQQSPAPEATFLFKHALVQDAAYGMLLREPRRALHARIVRALEEHVPGIVENQPELLARHAAEAGLTAQAATFWAQAGERSIARSALREAEEQLGLALGLLAGLPGTAAVRRQEIRLQLALANTLMHTKGYSATETREALRAVQSLLDLAAAAGESPEDPQAVFSVMYGLWATHLLRFNGGPLRELATEFLALAREQKATVPVMVGHRILAMALVFTGEPAGSRAHFDQALALYDPVEHRSLAIRFGQDVRAATLAYRALALWTLGHPDAARADSAEALRHARESGVATLMHALGATVLVQMHSGDFTSAAELSSELGTLARKTGAVFYENLEATFTGWICAATGAAADAVRLLPPSLTAFQNTGTFIVPLVLPYLARAYAEVGQNEEASRCVREALAEMGSHGERWGEAEIHRTSGEIALAATIRDETKAQAHFAEALAIARKQQARAWELRAATSLARLWRDQGRRREAHELLAPVHGWFTEGFDSLDLKRSAALLEELAS